MIREQITKWSKEKKDVMAYKQQEELMNPISTLKKLARELIKEAAGCRMPASVIKIKTKLEQMSDDELAQYLISTTEELKQRPRLKNLTPMQRAENLQRSHCVTNNRYTQALKQYLDKNEPEKLARERDICDIRSLVEATETCIKALADARDLLVISEDLGRIWGDMFLPEEAKNLEKLRKEIDFFIVDLNIRLHREFKKRKPKAGSSFKSNPEKYLAELTPLEKSDHWLRAILTIVKEKGGSEELQKLSLQVMALHKLFKADPELSFKDGMDQIFGSWAWPDWSSDIYEWHPEA